MTTATDADRTLVVVPTIGESIQTVFIGRWLKKVGDYVSAGEALVELDSDKASLEVPAPISGVLLEAAAAEGDEVAIGAALAWLRPGAAQPDSATVTVTATEKGPQAGPAARQAAAESGVDLAGVTGTGVRGRVLSKDVRAAAGPAIAGSAPAGPAPAASLPVVGAVVPAVGGAPGLALRTERVPMTPLRRTIARRLVEAQQTAAMLTTFNEVDMTNVMSLRKRYQDRFVQKYGRKVGFMSFFVKAVIEALKAYPEVNSEIDESNPNAPAVVYKHYYNIGVAVSTERGLMVPVVRDADLMSIAQVEESISELAGRGRDGKLRLDDFKDGTFTISNGGVFGSLMSTPILNPPQVGILGMHTIQQRPVAVDGRVEIRPMMYLALSYDHRIIDGRGAVGFLVRVKELVEDPERILLEV